MSERYQAAIQLSKVLADEGKLIEGGWVVLRSMIPPDASQAQIDEMRLAYMAGAEHLFASLLTILDPGTEPTDADLRRVDLINEELNVWRDEIQLRRRRAEGSA